MNNTILNLQWDHEISDSLDKDDISKIINLYEAKVNSHFCSLTDYFYLGLAYLMDGQEDIAQLTWLGSISEVENSNISETDPTEILVNILNVEADRLLEKNSIRMSWTIRRHIKEINPYDVINLTDLIILSDRLDILTTELLKEWDVLEVLKAKRDDIIVDSKKIELLLSSILKFPTRGVLKLTEELSTLVPDKKIYCNVLLKIAQEAKHKNLEFAAGIVKICLNYFPENLVVLRTIYLYYSNTKLYKEAIHWSRKFYEAAQGSEWELIAIYSYIREKTRGGDWLHIEPIISQYKSLISQIQSSDDTETEKDLDVSLAMPIIPNMLQYYQDNIAENKNLQNRIGKVFQKEMIRVFLEGNSLNSFEARSLKDFSYLRKIKPLNKKAKIKIGFLVSVLKLHSVGWLARGIFQYYDQDKFEFFLYISKQEPGDYFTHKWYESKVKKCTYFRAEEYLNVVESIYLDDIDILMDLDSTTSCESCVIMALKPAPIQATWLGYDASGVPAIDYFIVDPYLLSDDAQVFYSEKLWRLPRTYLAVDGFEVEVPTLSRQDLDIPSDAVVFLSAQTGQKRNPNTVRLQLQVLRSTPNSYLLIKGWGDDSTIQELFLELARDEAIDLSRLRFLGIDQNEFVHRANLQIADIILDTYPYNGATTTLEALWMGVPIVTRLGQQCAARNSYTFLKQVGVTEGIATTDDEYVNWGIRFGNDPELRKRVSVQLRQSRHTSSVWDTKEFVRDMETAWLEMREIYRQNNLFD